MNRLAILHSVTDRRTGRRADRRQYMTVWSA